MLLFCFVDIHTLHKIEKKSHALNKLCYRLRQLRVWHQRPRNSKSFGKSFLCNDKFYRSNLVNTVDLQTDIADFFDRLFTAVTWYCWDKNWSSSILFLWKGIPHDNVHSWTQFISENNSHVSCQSTMYWNSWALQRPSRNPGVFFRNQDKTPDNYFIRIIIQFSSFQTNTKGF